MIYRDLVNKKTNFEYVHLVRFIFRCSSVPFLAFDYDLIVYSQDSETFFPLFHYNFHFNILSDTLLDDIFKLRPNHLLQRRNKKAVQQCLSLCTNTIDYNIVFIVRF